MFLWLGRATNNVVGGMRYLGAAYSSTDSRLLLSGVVFFFLITLYFQFFPNEMHKERQNSVNLDYLKY